MKNKKSFQYISLCLLMALLFAACTKEGPQGIPGNPGDNGPAGAIGPAGKDGSTFLAGNGTPDAKTGNTGDYYLDQKSGNLYGPKTAQGWGNPFPFTAQGGGSMLAGSNAPDANIGVAGDFYLDTVNYTIYGPKAANGHWNIGLMLNGSGGSSGVTAYVINSPYDYITEFEDFGLLVIDIPFDTTNQFNLWDDVNQQQDLLAVYIRQKSPVYVPNFYGMDSIISYEDHISSANNQILAVGDPNIRNFHVSYKTNEHGLFISFTRVGGDFNDLCECGDNDLLNLVKEILGLQSIMIFVISPSAINNVHPPQPPAPVIEINNPYHDLQIQQLINPYLQ